MRPDIHLCKNQNVMINELIGEDLKKTSKQYLKAYPYARRMNTHLWEMTLTFIKMTHNKLGFGKNLIWKI